MEFNDLDIEDLERQRYDSIKRSGKYLELNILIGTEDDEFDATIGRVPVIATKARHISSEEIACMYITLKALVRKFEQEYPEDCALGLMKFNAGDMKSFTKFDSSNDDKEE